MAAQEQVSKVNLYAAIGPGSAQQPVSKVVVGALIGPDTMQLSVSKVVMYAIVDNIPAPTNRRRAGTSVGVGEFVRLT